MPDLNRVEEIITYESVETMLRKLLLAESYQTELLEEDPKIHAFIRDIVAPEFDGLPVQDLSYDEMGNLIIRMGEGKTHKSMLFVGNAMTHPQNGMDYNDYGRIVDGEQYGLPGKAMLGRGACEQKATLAAMLLAIKAVNKNAPLDGTLYFICCPSGETGKHDAIKSAVTSHNIKADMAVICGSQVISLGNRGRLDVIVRAIGKACHSSSPGKGANAITAAQLVIERLKSIPLPPKNPLLAEATLTVTSISSSPEATHTVQGECRMVLDRRLLPGEDPDMVFEEIRRSILELDGSPDPVSGLPFRFEVEKSAHMYPSMLEESSPVVQGLIAAGKELGIDLQTEYTNSAFDQGYLNHAGIPCCNFGAGEERFAHTELDMASLTHVYDAARIYARFIHNNLGRQ